MDVEQSFLSWMRIFQTQLSNSEFFFKVPGFYCKTFRELSEVKSWKEDVLHRIVDSFLSLRFPMFLVLNKADLPTACKHIDRFVWLNLLLGSTQ